jgi:hypothetical protein
VPLCPPQILSERNIYICCILFRKHSRINADRLLCFLVYFIIETYFEILTWKWENERISGWKLSDCRIDERVSFRYPGCNNRDNWLKPWVFWLVLEKCPFLISARTQNILTEDFHGSPTKRMPDYQAYLKISHDLFLPHSFQLSFILPFDAIYS